MAVGAERTIKIGIAVDMRVAATENTEMNIMAANQIEQMQRILWLVLGLRSGLLLTQVGLGLWSHSLSLLVGSGHLFSDLVTLGLTLLATWLIQNRSTVQSALGLRQLEAWVALLNGVSLGTVALLIGWEGVKHLQVPEPVLGLPMLVIAGLNLFINGLIVQLLNEHSHDDLNVRGVLLHGVADTASSVSVILSACAVYFYQWFWADAVGGLMAAILIGLSAISLIYNGWQHLKHRSI